MDQTKEKTVFKVINLTKNGEALDPGRTLSYEATIALGKTDRPRSPGRRFSFLVK